MNLAKDTQRIIENNKIKEEDKHIILDLFMTSSKIDFGKIGPRQEGYIYKSVGYPRCTSVLQMDGTRAAALMEWAKKEIVEDAKMRLKYELAKTGVLDNESIDFLLNISYESPDRQKDEAANEGSEAHDNFEKWLNKEDGVIEDNNLRRFVNVWKAEGAELICTEMPLVYVDEKTGHGFGGKLDILAYKNGKFIIYDNKTSKSVHNSYGMQISAYKHAVEQMSNNKIKIVTGKIIHIPNVSKLKDWQTKLYKKLGSLVECKNLEEAFTHYSLLLEQYYRRNNKYF